MKRPFFKINCSIFFMTAKMKSTILLFFIVCAVASVNARFYRCALSSTSKTASDNTKTTTSCNQSGSTIYKVGSGRTYCNVGGSFDKQTKFYNSCYGNSGYKVYALCAGNNHKVIPQPDGKGFYLEDEDNITCDD